METKVCHLIKLRTSFQENLTIGCQYKRNMVFKRGHIVPPHHNQNISSKRVGVWRFRFGTFLSMNFPFRKVYFHHSTLMYVAMATIQLFGLTVKTRIFIVFQVTPTERIFLWENLPFRHNTLRSLVEANIRSVTVERFHKIILPKYGQ